MDQLRLGDPAPDFAELRGRRGPVAERPPHRSEIVGRKGSIFYRAHSYHTKVPPEGIAEAIRHYTDPGAIVVDPFSGSGMTGVACLLTGRRGVLSDLSPAAVHIARNYVRPTDPDRFQAAGSKLLAETQLLERDLYGTRCQACGSTDARIEYTVWSDVYECPRCHTALVFWEVGLKEDRSGIRSVITCPGCHEDWKKRDLRWLRSVPVLVSVSCPDCKTREQRPLSEDELSNAVSLSQDDIPFWFPTDRFDPWREMWRGQHGAQGIETAADFYTPRNLWALAALWDRIASSVPSDLRDSLRFAFTSIVNRASRRYQWNAKRPTNVLSSTMYVASLSYEFNVFSLLRRKLTTLRNLYQTTNTLPGRAEVHQAPAQHLEHLPDQSVDYIFTDPPFGSNIYYGDSSFLWEAWLQDQTDLHLETVVNRSLPSEQGGKDVAAYEKLMTAAFEEMARVLRPNAWASVMFHNSDDGIWSALQRAIDAVGFEVGSAVAFDKSQPSFKGVKGMLDDERVPAFDLVLHLRAREAPFKRHTAPVKEEAIVERVANHLRGAPPSRRTTPYLHSLVMRILLEDGLPPNGWSYAAVEDLCRRHFKWEHNCWNLPLSEPGAER